MNNSIFKFECPKNEPLMGYMPCSSERIALEVELKKLSESVMDIPLIIGGKEVRTGVMGKVVMPHKHAHVLANYHIAGEKEIQMAVNAALAAREKWEQTSWIDRVSVTIKIAELISKKYRALLNAATMLGQSKNAFQAEIDSACEVIDFLRFNAFFVSEIYNGQPISEDSHLNRTEYRPLEGFCILCFSFQLLPQLLQI